ncbi:MULTISPECIES: DUF1024 family protein [unclassified Staphylococcus]|uniref:DUF1024 family protein n=1 Tax=unclassified Staphylococcus TaxID=91994 RepID=UPI00068A3DC5|nr:DUF1024 family protein [Staphylococcus sp. ZWU0021]
MAYEYEHEHRNMKAGVYSGLATNESVEEIKEVYRKAKAFDEVKQYALSKNKDFEDRKDTARSNKEFNYFNTLQIANRAIINKCKQLEDK